LFICNHNLARSQIAEGLLKSLYGEYYEVYNAGVDISGNRSKNLKEFEDLEFDYVVTVCDGEGQKCPCFSGGKTYIQKSFEDPAAVNGDDPVKFDAFRRNRKDIKFWLEKTFKV
jgi:arsenate reductase